jgi:VCBS repeat-containing protein
MAYTSQIEASFSGISDLTSNPPHNALAAGPNYVVMSEGARIEWTDLSGGSGVVQSMYQFFGSLGPAATNALFDPRAAYDPVNGRYIVTVDNIGANGTISNIDIAVSKDANPNDGWYLVSLNTSLTINGQLTASDQPTVSVDGTNIYITAPQYYVSGGYAGTEAWVVGDTAGAGGGVYNGGTLTVIANEVTSPAQSIYRVVAGNNGTSYYADAYSSGSQTIINLQVYNLASNTFGPPATLALGDSDQGNGGSDFTAQQQGTSLLLDAGDSTLQNIVYASGFLYGISEVKPAGSSVPLVHWFQIDVGNPANPTVVAQGDISGAPIGNNVATFDGSIAVDGAGDVIVNFTASGPNMYPADYYVYRGSTDPLNAFSAPILYQASSGFFNSGDGSSVQRWGSNSSATADATDPHAFWLSGEYVANSWWQTSVAKIEVQTRADTKTDEDSPIGGSLASLVSAGSTFAAGTFTSQDGATVTIAADGSYTYDPTGVASFESLRVGQTIVDRFSYTSTDATGVSTTGTMLVDVGVVDSGPVTTKFNASAHIGAAFSGISNTENYPPENGLAVGQSAIVSAEGSRIEWTDLSGGASTIQSIYQFFGSLGSTLTNSLFDTRVAYDSVNRRFVATVDNLGPNGTVSDIDVAVSKDSNPNDGWYFTALNTSLTINGQLTSSDQPFVSADGTNIYITAPQYNVNVPGYAGTELWVIGDTAGSGGGIYNGGALTVVASEGTSSNLAVFSAVPGNNDKAYYSDAFSSGGQTIINVQAYDLITNTFGPTATLALGNSDQGGGGSDYTAQQQGTALLLDAGNARIQNLAYWNSFLYGVSEVKPVGSNVPLVHWFQIDVGNPANPIVVAQGNISGAPIGNNVATFDGSIAVDGAGDVVINFTASGPTMYPADYYVFRGATDPPGTFSAPILYQASTGFFNSGDGSSVQRWGDNSSTVVDPNNPHTFWLSGEYVANGWWQTSVAQVAISTPVATSTSANTPISGNLASLVTPAEPTDSGDVLSFTTGTFTSVDGAKVTIGSNGSYTYDPTGVAAFQALSAGQTATDGFTYTVADNHGASSVGTLTIDVTSPDPPAVTSIATSGAGIANGNGDLNAGKVVTLTVNLSEAVNVNTAAGSPTLSLNDGGIANYVGGSGTSALTFSYTVLSGQNTSDLTVSSFNLNGAAIADGAGNVANLSGATNYNPSGTLQIDTTAPAITINTIASNNVINATKAASGFSISGSTGGVENGQVVTVQILNSANTVVDSYSTADQSNAWAVSVTSAQTTGLADGSYTVTANVSDKAGNPAPQATHALTVDEDKSPESPALAIGSTSLTVAAGGSIPLGVTATPVDSDDRLRVTISGVPSYETITAPSGDNVSKSLQSNGTYSWTITESSSLTGKPIGGLTLKSNYTGTGQPTATFTITASNITSGETSTSSAQTISVTDPSLIASGSPGSFNPLATTNNSASNAVLNRIAALFDQFIAAGFHGGGNSAGSMAPPTPLAAIDELTTLTHPQH